MANAASTAMRRCGELLRILALHLFDGSDPGRQTKALFTSCQAVSRLGTSASDKGVVIVVMALLSFCGFDTPSLAAHGGQRLLP